MIFLPTRLLSRNIESFHCGFIQTQLFFGIETTECSWNLYLCTKLVLLLLPRIIPFSAFYCQVISVERSTSVHRVCLCVCPSYEYMGACLSSGLNPIPQTTPLSWITKEGRGEKKKSPYLRPNVWDCSKWKREFILASELTAISLSIRSCRSTAEVRKSGRDTIEKGEQCNVTVFCSN